MLGDKAYLTEFLTEVNFVLTQDDLGNKLDDFVNPVKNLFLNSNELLSFSLARYCGASSRVAFFSQWYYQVLQITTDTSKLISENKTYLQKKIPLKLKGVPGLYNLVDKHIHSIFLPQQLSLIQVKTKTLIDDLVTKYSYLHKYLSQAYLSQFASSELITVKKLYQEELTLSQFYEAQGLRTSFVQIALPCLLGLSYNFNQPTNPINPKGIKWVLLEEVLKDIARLHQTGQDKNLFTFIHLLSLNERDEFEWWQKDSGEKLQQALASSKTRERTKGLRDTTYENIKSNLQALNFPEQYKAMLKDLADWAFDPDN